MPVDLRFSLPAVAIASCCALVVVVRAALAPEPVPRRHATIAERIEIAANIATAEKEWTRDVAQGFPDDNWSQRDDFHGREFRRIQDLSAEKGVRMEDILRAVDDDLHTARARSPNDPDARSAHAVPCKPRPFYD